MKKILALAPVMPDEGEISQLESSLEFLKKDYQLDFLDPLSKGFNLKDKAFFECWLDEIQTRLPDYEAFIGFSLGGVILQQSMELFTKLAKPIFLFSTPSFADEALKQKLGEVVQLCEEGNLEAALRALYSKVFISVIPPQCMQVKDKKRALSRLIFGLNLVLNSDSRAILAKTLASSFLFIGEKSALVNEANIFLARNTSLIQVPEAGMRVLQENALFCQKVILEKLNEAFK